MSAPAGVHAAELREHPDGQRTGQQPSGERGGQPRTPPETDHKPDRGQCEGEREQRQRRARDGERSGPKLVGGR